MVAWVAKAATAAKTVGGTAREFLLLAPTDSAGQATDTQIIPATGVPVTYRDGQGAAKTLHRLSYDLYVA